MFSRRSGDLYEVRLIIERVLYRACFEVMKILVAGCCSD